MYAFIGGPPTAGKTHLAQEFVNKNKLGICYCKIDDFRKELKEDLNMKKWVNFFRNQNENEYWQKNSPLDHVKNLVSQSKALWPEILKKINQKMNLHEYIIFEGVTIIPELARKYLDFPGIYLIPTDKETIYIRLKAHARWGKTDDLKRLESIAFYEGDSMFYEKSANEYGYKVFKDINNASMELIKIFNI